MRRSAITDDRKSLATGLFFALLLIPHLSRSVRAETAPQAAEKADQKPSTHPLMPGIRAADLWDRNWPRTMHDRLATGFSPLDCGMKRTPVVWSSIDLGGALNWVQVVKPTDDGPALLVDDGRLRLISAEGKLLWSRASTGGLVYQGDLCGNRGSYLLMAGGPRLSLLEMNSGKTLWKHQFEPKHVAVRTQVADLLPERPGLEAAIFLNYGEEGCVINFPPEGQPQVVWQKRVVTPGEFDERYDHRCHIRLDLSQPDAPVIWNVRRFRCRGFDARTGELLSSIEYDIGGAQRRNYGPFFLGQGRDGALFACVFGERVQTHVHAIRLHRQGMNELTWQHYYGEVYKEAPGVAVASHGVVDLDGDGTSEMVYSVRDPAEDYRTFVRIRDVETGQIEFELPDHWGCSLFSDVGPEKVAGLMAFPSPAGATPSRGPLEIYRFGNTPTPELLGVVNGAGLWGPMTVAAEEGQEFLIRERDDRQRDGLSRYSIVDGHLRREARTEAAELLVAPIHAVVPTTPKQDAYVVSSPRGRLEAYSWAGRQFWHHPLRGGAAAHLSAADLDEDGKAELVAATVSKRLHVFDCNEEGVAHKKASYEYQVGWYEHHPAIYDLEGTGRLCLLTNGTDSEGRFTIRAYRTDGSLLWESPLDVAADTVTGCVLNAGRFIAPDHAGVAVSVTDSRLIHEGTYMLDGLTGKILWYKHLHRDGGISMPYRPRGISTAYDFDKDGTEEIGMDLLSYMAYLRGSSGDFAYVRHTHNIRAEGAVYAGHLYNTYCPVYRHDGDEKPHWFVTAGFGPFGLMKPDPTEGVWRRDLAYDGPPNVALVDVDGDGSLEAGYAARNSTTFVCHDVWSGKIEWKLELPIAPNSPSVTADVDGDGKGEFLCGSYCIGTDDLGRGKLRWQSPVPFGWPIIADFDGDGLGEIAVARPGEIVILNAP